MTPVKWSLILILGGITLLGLPIGALSEVLTEEMKPSSAKDCRVHIDKALEQYWDKKESSEDEGSIPETNKYISPDQDKLTTETNINNKINANNLDDENEDDETEDDLSNENDIDEKDIDEDDEEDEDTESYEDETETGDDDDDDDNMKITDEDDDDAKESNEDDDDVDDDININEDEAEDDEDKNNDEENDLLESKESTSNIDSSENQSNDQNNYDDDEEDDEEEDDEEDDDEEDDVETNTEKSLHNFEKSEQTKDHTISDINNQKINLKDKSENIDDSKDSDAEDESKTDNDLKANYTVDERNLERDTSSNEIKIEIEVESDKVTGEADRATTRMATEFLDDKPSPYQPEASKVEEKNITLPDDTEDDEDDESGSDNDDELEDFDDDSIENIYEDDDDDSTSGVTYRSRDHIDVILGLDEIGTEYDKEDEKNAQIIFKDIKKIHLTQIKPMEMLYKYTDSTTRALGDAEIFNKPMLLFLGPWSAGKTSIINYLLGIERTPAVLKTGTGVTDVDFTLITYGDQKRIISGTELATDWRYAGVQKFGQGFLDHFRTIQIQHTLLKKITIVDSPGILENKKNSARGYSLNDAFQWFIDRADAIYVVLDPNKVDIGGELGSVVDQLKGRDARFILNKADTIRRSDLMRVVGQLFWNLSPLMSSTEAPLIYAVSLTTKPYHPSAPAKFLSDQEKNFFYDMKSTLDKRVENRILYARRHAVRVRNHAKMVDCYLATYYRHKSIFSSKRNVAKLITENPREYNIFDGLGGMTNISRYDLPDPIAYKEFFKLHPLYDFKPLASTCSYFRGCPMDKLDLAISKDIPELLAKYKKIKLIDTPKQER